MAETVVGLLIGALKGELGMVEAGIGEFARELLADPDARGDEVGVEPGFRRMAGEIDNIAPRRRLAAGKVDVQRAERGGLAEHALPGLAVELIARALERDGVRAIKTAERAAMGELDQKPDRRGGRRGRVNGHVSSTLLALRSASMATTSFSITAGGAE